MLIFGLMDAINNGEIVYIVIFQNLVLIILNGMQISLIGNEIVCNEMLDVCGM